jgi:hypothetical protein
MGYEQAVEKYGKEHVKLGGKNRRGDDTVEVHVPLVAESEYSALSGQYGHSGKLQTFDSVEEDVLSRLKQLSGLVKTM